MNISKLQMYLCFYVYVHITNLFVTFIIKANTISHVSYPHQVVLVLQANIPKLTLYILAVCLLSEDLQGVLDYSLGSNTIFNFMIPFKPLNFKQ